MNILAFESSCDETSAAVLSCNDGKFEIKSNIIASQIETHRLYGGVVPEIASRAHIEAISKITYEALDVSGVNINEIDLVAVTANPGLIGALLVGVNFAKSLAAANGIPLVAVDHIKGHIFSALLTENAPVPPFLALTISGGHTAIYRVNTYMSIEMIATTRDDAIGESFDKIGRIIGIPYPAGKEFDALSREGFIKATGSSDNFYNLYKKSDAYRDPDMTLPSPAIAGDTLDLSFSGLKTAAMNLINKFEMKNKKIDRALFAARYTYEAVEALTKRVGEALLQNPDMPLIVSGGVAANSHIRARLTEISERRGRKIYIPPLSLCGDNAAMIAIAGYYEYLAGNFKDTSLNASALDSII